MLKKRLCEQPLLAISFFICYDKTNLDGREGEKN